MDGSAAQSIYRLEKERAMQERRLSHTALMAEAKEAFAKLLADAQLARKGGRPRTNPLPPPKLMAVVEPVPAAKAAASKSTTSAKREGSVVKKAGVKKTKAAVKAKPKKAAKPAKAAKKAKPAAKKKPAKKRV
jgi:hypothetical protein